MGLMDILNGMQNGPRGQTDPNAKGGMSPITMAILALLAYKAYQKSGIGTGAPAPAPAPGRIPDRNTIDANLPGGGMGSGLNDLLKGGLGGLLGGLAGGAPQGRLPGGTRGGSVRWRAGRSAERRAWRTARGWRGRQRARQRARRAAQAVSAERPRRRRGLLGQQRAEQGDFHQRFGALNRPRRHRRAGRPDRSVARRSLVRLAAAIARSGRSAHPGRAHADRGRGVALGVSHSPSKAGVVLP